MQTLTICACKMNRLYMIVIKSNKRGYKQAEQASIIKKKKKNCIVSDTVAIRPKTTNVLISGKRKRKTNMTESHRRQQLNNGQLLNLVE